METGESGEEIAKKLLESIEHVHQAGEIKVKSSVSSIHEDDICYIERNRQGHCKLTSRRGSCGVRSS